MLEAIKKRHEIADEFKWDTSEIFGTDADWEREYAALGGAISGLEAFRGRLAESGVLQECLKLGDELSKRNGLLWLYAFLKFSEDAGNSAYAAMSGKADTLGAKLGAAASFIVPELLNSDEAKILAEVELGAELAVYRHYLHNVFREKAHVLSPEAEELLALAHEVTDAPETIFSMISDADMRFGIVEGEDGRQLELTHSRYQALMQCGNRGVRRAAYLAHYTAYMNQKNTLAATLGAWIKRNIFFAKVRKYSSPLHAALSANNIPAEVYTNLINTVRGHSHLLRRYLDIRKKALGLGELCAYDLSVPIVHVEDTKISWEGAKATLLEALEPLGKDYIDTVRHAYSKRWIDVYENAGKTSGAYSVDMYGAHPYVLMNFNNTMDDLFTLAHEVGHMMHAYYTNAAQPYVYANSTVFTAEVASTVNEALLTHYLLRTVDDKAKRAYVINQALDGYVGTLFRQAMLADFELQAHEEAAAGEPTTHEGACALYRRLNEQQYGSAVTLDPEADYGWARIPHFYMGFYVYQYATGKSAAAALARGILSGDAAALGAYKGFLAAGSSDYSINLLRAAGVDMSVPRPIQAAMADFEELLAEMERLVG
ncbi:MAG: oligoendopeptidase F [Defluviitaleaceae bacterium]|nr:oligoendopeptidase F [Defluviitaleaceae bacterium]